MLLETLREASAVLAIYALSLFVPAGVSFYWGNLYLTAIFAFSAVMPYLFCLLVGYVSRPMLEMDARHAIMVLMWVWLGVVFISAQPFLWAFNQPWHVLFAEVVSALTTSGIELVGDVSAWPPSFLWYRQQLSWLGGIGVIVLSLGLMSLYQSSPYTRHLTDYGIDMRGLGFSERVTKTATYASMVYLAMTGLSVLSYWLSGLTLWRAMLESMTIISTGGFSLSAIDPSLYLGAGRQLICCVFMLLGATGLHVFALLFQKKWTQAWQRETKQFLLFIVCSAVVISLFMKDAGVVSLLFWALSFVSTTGVIGLDGFPSGLMMWLVVCGLIGGCAGSTASGIKVYRVTMITRAVRVFLEQAWQPNRVAVVTDEAAVSQESIVGVQSLVLVFCLSVLLAAWLFVLSGLGIDMGMWVALSAVTNVGVFAPEQVFLDMGVYQHLILMALMLLGRVEFVAILVLFLPRYWR